MNDEISASEQPPVAPYFRVWLCGPFRLERRVEESYIPVQAAEWGGRSYPRLLLKALLCTHRRQLRREALLERLWPELDFAQATQNLNMATTKLRSVLRPTKARESLLVTEDDASVYCLEGQQFLWVDADSALTALAAAEQMGETTPSTCLLLEEATGYFERGGFLEGEEGLWASGRRATIERAYYRCRLHLAEMYAQQGKAGRAERLLSMLLEDDPTDEDVLCCLMMLLHQQGMTHQALRLYEYTCK